MLGQDEHFIRNRSSSSKQQQNNNVHTKLSYRHCSYFTSAGCSRFPLIASCSSSWPPPLPLPAPALPATCLLHPYCAPCRKGQTSCTARSYVPLPHQHQRC